MNTPDKCPKCAETGILFEWGSADAAVQHCIEFRCDSITKRRVGSDEWVLVSEGRRCIINQRDQLAERVKRLEEAGDSLLEIVEAEAYDAHLADQIPHRADAWRKAKEVKP